MERPLGFVSRLGAVVLPALLAAPPISWAASWNPIEQVAGAAPLRVLVHGKARVYFRLTSEAALSVRVQGPGRLRVVSRAEVLSGARTPVSYTIQISEGHRTLKEHMTESSTAPDARLADETGSTLCKSRSFTLDVPAGDHSFSLWVSGSPSVLVRLFLSAPKREGQDMVSITPVEAPRSVTVSEGERLIAYYSILPGKPVKLRLVGPTNLELSSRLDYDATMRGEQRYTLAISSSGKQVREVRLRTTKAVSAAYTNLKDRVPSKLDRIVVPLGPGVHELKVDLVEPKRGSVEIHARIPQPAVGNQE